MVTTQIEFSANQELKYVHNVLQFVFFFSEFQSVIGALCCSDNYRPPLLSSSNDNMSQTLQNVKIPTFITFKCFFCLQNIHHSFILYSSLTLPSYILSVQQLVLKLAVKQHFCFKKKGFIFFPFDFWPVFLNLTLIFFYDAIATTIQPAFKWLLEKCQIKIFQYKVKMNLISNVLRQPSGL